MTTIRIPPTQPRWLARKGLAHALTAAISLALLASLPEAAAAGDDAFAQNQWLGRGMNVLGYDPIWRSFDQARFHAKHFGVIRQGGFDSVRVNLHAFRHQGPGPDYRLSEAWWRTTDWILTNALASGLAVIVDFHEFNAMGDQAEKNKPKFLAFWRQVSTRLKDASPKVMFELLNEPCHQLTADLWNAYAAEALAVVRASNPNRAVIIGPAFWNSVDHLSELTLPETDRNLIVTVHYYKPMTFTHQGASWTDQKDKTGIDWLSTPAERSAITQDFDRVQAWAKEHRRPILLGEFGSYDRANMASRVRYTAFVARAAEARGWSWAYWQFDSDFIAYDFGQDRWVEPIRGALIPATAARPSP